MVFTGYNLDYTPKLEIGQPPCFLELNMKVGKNFTACKFTVVLERRLWKYFIEKIIPATLIVMVSWVTLFATSSRGRKPPLLQVAPPPRAQIDGPPPPEGLVPVSP